MKCPKCGLVIDGKHAPEFYSGCRRCTALIQRARLTRSPSGDPTDLSCPIPIRSDSFCESCGRLLIAPSRFCIACEPKHRKSEGS